MDSAVSVSDDVVYLDGYKVWLMPYSLENLRQLYDKAQQHRVLFSDDIHGDFHKFCEVFFTMDYVGNVQAKGIVWIVEDFVGVYYLTRITQREAHVDFSFFDGKLRFPLTKAMADFVFKLYGFDRVNVDIAPYSSKYVFKFIEKLGFKYEGRRRKAIVYKGEQVDLIQFGLLREEFYELQS